jgi:hypothetical protein
LGAGTSSGGVLAEILLYEWHRPVLQTLADGAKRYVEIKAELFRTFDPAPGEGQINMTLRELSRLGLVRKGVGMREPWTLTLHGEGALEDLRQLDQLMAADPAFSASTRSDGAARGDLAARADAFNPSVAHQARRYNYWLGGKDNFHADRVSGDELEKVFPGMRAGVRANRDVLGRVVRALAAEYRVRQFLDIGTGLPTADNTHEVAQAIVPASRVVYVDNDPLVLVHARALLTSSPEGRTAYIEADLRDSDAIVDSPAVRENLDLTEPVALLLVGVLHFIPGEGAASPIVERLMTHLASGSFLFVTHVTNDFLPRQVVDAHEQIRRDGRSDFWMRTKAEIMALFDGLHVLSPGVVPLTKWRPDPDTADPELSTINAWVGVGRKP